MADQVDIRIMFSLTDPDTGLAYTDALYFSVADYQALAPGQLEELEQARFDTWKTLIANPPPVSPPLPLDQQVAQVVEQIQGLFTQGADLVNTLPPELALPIAQGVADQAQANADAIADQVNTGP